MRRLRVQHRALGPTAQSLLALPMTYRSRFGDPSVFNLILLVFLAVPLWILIHSATGRDDVYLTLWQAKTLAEHGALWNYNGEPVIQSSSLLHVLLLAALYKVSGIALPTLAYWFCLVLGAGTVAMSWWLASLLPGGNPLATAAFCVIFPFLPYWSLGSLETTLVALALSAYLGGLLTKLRTGTLIASASAIAYVLARPEAVFVLAAFNSALLAVWLMRRRQNCPWANRAAISFAASMLASGALCWWMIFYTGRPMPQPVYAKVGGVTLGAIVLGIKYLYVVCTPTLLFLCGAIAAVTLSDLMGDAGLDDPRLITGTLVLAYLAFVITSGGDWMEGGRFVVPILPAMAALGIASLPRISLATAGLLAGGTAIACLTTSLISLLSLYIGAAGAITILAALPLAAVLIIRAPRGSAPGAVAIAAVLISAVVSHALFFVRESTGTNFFRVESVKREAALRSKRGVAFLDSDYARSFEWVEWANRIHIRDILFIDRIESILRPLNRRLQRPVVVATSQGGMVVYYLAARNPSALRFIDMAGLFTNDFTRCPASQGNARGSFGLSLPLGGQGKMRELFERCGLPQPDIVFWLGDASTSPAGYVAVDSVPAAFLGGEHYFDGPPVSLGQTVAVRRDLLRFVR